MTLLLTNGKMRYMPPEMCTLDHLEPRWHPERGQHESDLRIVAACLKCNNGRDRELLKQIPPELVRKASQGHKPTKLAKEYAKILAPLFPVVNVPKPKTLHFTFEPEPREIPGGPLRVPLSDYRKLTG
jgi:hypothetical protein